MERHEFILQAGQIERHLYWIKKGAIRIFYQTEFEEHTIRFGYQGSLINALPSYVKEEPSELYLQAIRKSTLVAIKKSDFRAFIGEDVNRLQQYNAFMEMMFVQALEREIDLLTYSPLERYQRVLERSPHLFQEVPAKYIASYLRMTPETLSRIQKS